MKYKKLWIGSMIVEALFIWSLYSPYERINIYIAVCITFVFINFMYLIFNLFYKSRDLTYKRLRLSRFIFIGLIGLLSVFAYYQFTFTIMPYEFHNSEAFPYGYSYGDYWDDVRIIMLETIMDMMRFIDILMTKRKSENF